MQILKNISLKPYHTFGVEVNTRYFTEAASREDIKNALDFARKNKLSFMIIGGGSNVLFKDNFDGLIIKNNITAVSVKHENDKYIFIKSGAGEKWPEFVDFCVKNGWSGLENLSLIPGTVGAAPVQNIGAYGREIKDTVEIVEVFDAVSGKILELTKSQCEFGYRTSIFKTKFKNRYIVLSVLFRLQKHFVPDFSYQPLKDFFKNTNSITIKGVSEAVKSIRRSKLPDPDKTGNAGSFFKNPVVEHDKAVKLKELFSDMPVYPAGTGMYKLAAGWLIEQCGWKGKQVGDAGVNAKQALVLVNYGNATGKQILDLAMDIKNSVFKKFGVVLEFEVNVV